MEVYREFSRKSESAKINKAYNKLSEISILLGYARSRKLKKSVNKETLVSNKTIGSILQRAMEYEITSLYYVALNQEFFTAPIQFYVALQESPIKTRLSNLLNKSMELKQYFSILSMDCIKFHTDAGSMMVNSLY